MSTASIVLVVTTIIAIDGDLATIDAGKAQYLRSGDRGRAFYELEVDGLSKRIEVGTVTVIATGEGSATVIADSRTALRSGYRVEVQLPIMRIPEPGQLGDRVDSMGEGRSEDVEQVLRPGESKPLRDLSPSPENSGPPPELPSDYPIHTLPAVRVEGEEEIAEDSWPPESARDTIDVSPGRYSMGLDLRRAQFLDQTPPHEVSLSGFTIDRQPMGMGSDPLRSGVPMTGVSFLEAQATCQELGLRLPTEEEWLIATRSPGFEVVPGLYEWTASWYRPFPGNSHREAAFGETYRVLKGSSPGAADSILVRRFIDPAQRSLRIGFRCVKDPD